MKQIIYKIRSVASLHALTLTCALIFAGAQAPAQTWYWVKQTTGTGSVQPMSSSTPASGYTFLCGFFYGSPTFNTTTLTDPGNGDGFLTRLNTNGTPAWAVSISGTLDQYATAVISYGADVFVTGSYSGTTTLGTTSGSPVTITGSGLTNNFFVARYNTNGVLQWVQTLPALGDCDPEDIELNTSLQRIYISGTATGGAFALCYDYTGALQWNTAITCSQVKSGGLAVDASGNTHLLFSFYGTLTIPTGGSFTATSGEKLLLAKLDGTGAYVTGSAIGQGTSSSFIIRPEDIDIDLSGNLYLGGEFQSGTLILSGNSVPNSGNRDVFLAKYNSSYAYQWHTKTSGAGGEAMTALCVDNSGNVFAGVQNFENNALTFACYPTFNALFGNTDEKLLIMKYTSAGVLDWIINPELSSGMTNIGAISTNGNGTAIVSGMNVGTSVFGSTTLTSSGIAYMTRVKGQNQLPVVSNASICSGSTATLTVTAPSGGTFYWYNSTTGGVIHTGSSYTTPVLYNAGSMPVIATYYVSNSLCTGSSYRVPVNVFVNPVPDLSAVPTNVYSCGGCVTIGLPYATIGETYAIYNSTSGTSVLIANSYAVSVCPKKPAIYTLVATNQYGCTNSVTIYVNPAANNPNFSLTSTPASGYFTLAATPVVSYATANSVPGFGYAWILEELDGSGSTLFIVNNPSCWWNFSTTPTLVFNGFDHVTYPYSGTVTLSSCSTPSVGKFLSGRTYRVTRGTWNDNCPWEQYSVTMDIVRNAVTGEPEIQIQTGSIAPDFSQYALSTETVLPEADGFSLYPNPTTGSVTIESELLDDASVQIMDLAGNTLRVIRTNGSGPRKVIDLSAYAKGTYLVRITTRDQVITRRVILH